MPTRYIEMMIDEPGREDQALFRIDELANLSGVVRCSNLSNCFLFAPFPLPSACIGLIRCVRLLSISVLAVVVAAGDPVLKWVCLSS